MDLVDRTGRTAKIRCLNDKFRTAFAGGDILITPGVQGFDSMSEVLELVRTYDTFNEDNDPHGEHDFGAFDFGGERFFWKIDYYGDDLNHGSEDPGDSEPISRSTSKLPKSM